jgi:Uma2 family endonuclease
MALTEQLTLEQFLRLPDTKPAQEFERGRVLQKLEPGARHARLQGEVAALIEMHCRPSRSAVTFIEAIVSWLDEDVSYIPDAIAYRRERVPIDADGYIANHLTVPPDVAVEVSAIDQSLTDQMNRCRWYVAHGVSMALLVRHEIRSVWTFRPGVDSGPLQGDDAIDLDDIFAGLSFTVAELFGAMRPRSR